MMNSLYDGGQSIGFVYTAFIMSGLYGTLRNGVCIRSANNAHRNLVSHNRNIYMLVCVCIMVNIPGEYAMA
jgi:hypothetical protein